MFPYLPEGHPFGITVYTATRWGALVRSRKIPADMKRPTAVDCYRFVLSHPAVHLVMTGPKDAEEMRANLGVLDAGPMSSEEMAWMRRVGDAVYGRHPVWGI